MYYLKYVSTFDNDADYKKDTASQGIVCHCAPAGYDNHLHKAYALVPHTDKHMTIPSCRLSH